MLASCVTTHEKAFPDKVNKQKALESQIQIAVNFLQQNEAEKAIFHLKQAVRDNPDSAVVHEILALALEKTGEFDLAEQNFNKMIKNDSSYTRGRANYGSYLIRRGECKEAVKQLKRVVEDIYYPNRAITYYQMGQCYQKLGNIEEVGRAYQKAVALDGNFAPALLELSVFRFDNKDYAGSLEFLNKYRSKVEKASAKALLLGIKLARVFEDKNNEASYTLALKNLYPESAEYLEYLTTIKKAK
ncbi:MAG: type IV pilus biogenesis/stability protein PilW [Methanosarcina sp.]|nr:type IV pilus biogenesis/stability protein PilW [Methanosarcina sp.]